MRILIMAAGKSKTWNRYGLIVHGEPILERTVRLLAKRGIMDVWISANRPDERDAVSDTIAQTVKKFPHVRVEINNLTGNDLGCIYGVKFLKPDVVLFGDVFFTEDALHTILHGNTNFYGRNKSSATKNWGEMFAFKTEGEFWDRLETFWQMYKKGEVKRCWSWDLYGWWQGKSYYKHNITGNFTTIDDKTDDFDKPEDYKKWIDKYE